MDMKLSIPPPNCELKNFVTALLRTMFTDNEAMAKAFLARALLPIESVKN
jgi:hypothetical protein